jgi:tetratricopeptide (TPR) repeat protein
VSNVIAENLIEEAEDKPSIIEIYFDFVYNNIFPGMGESPVDKGALNTLVRGIGWCDQQAFVLNDLCSYQHIEAARLDLQTHHSVSLILVESKFDVERPLSGGIFDPLNGIIFKDESGKVAEYEDLHTKNKRFRSLAGANYDRKTGQDYLNYFRHELPKKLTYPRSMEVDNWRKVIRKAVKIYHLLGANIYFNLYQDAYLSMSKEQAWALFDLSLPDTRLYYRARCYQLVGRFQKAAKTYARLIKQFPDSEFTERSCVFRAASLMKLKKWDEARKAIEEFNDQYPSSPWKSVGQSYLEWITYYNSSGPLPVNISDVRREAFYFN